MDSALPSPRSRFRPTTTTVAPRRASSRAVASPMPAVPPVTRQVFPAIVLATSSMPSIYGCWCRQSSNPLLLDRLQNLLQDRGQLFLGLFSIPLLRVEDPAVRADDVDGRQDRRLVRGGDLVPAEQQGIGVALAF